MPQRVAPAAFALLLAAVAGAEPVLVEGFDQQGSWRKAVRGKGAVELVDGGVEGKCLKTVSEDKALVYYSIGLPLDKVRGKRLVIRAKVKLEDVTQGPETYSTAKLHVGAIVGGKTQNFAQRFLGTRDWHDQVLVAAIPQDAARVTLDLGIQNGTGTAWFDNLVVDDGVKEHVPLSLRLAANASHNGAVTAGSGSVLATGLFDLRNMPAADVRLAGTDFYVMAAGENYGRTCVALRGAAHPKLPARIETAVPVAAKASRLFFLQAAIGLDPSRKTPCLVYIVRYDDGKTVEIPIREGVDIGALDAPKDLANWKVAWTSKQGDGAIGLGVATWTNPRPSVPIRFIRLTTPGAGALPVVVAISLDPKGT